jgi:hypothetical protein
MGSDRKSLPVDGHVVVDAFTLGKSTDWEAEPCETGDAFVIAPDGEQLPATRESATGQPCAVNA